ncbi:MAG: hypothetical protein NC914_01520, partial [Candidatus Omnitrophica bacterium]|nr:hypothetical protein [Candidatus Omnitrophota bacterium]
MKQKQKYSCLNCANLKTMIISRSAFNQLSREKIARALANHDPDALGLAFPFNMTVYKRVKKDGFCRIIYC